MRQFLFEAGVLTFLGGIIGIIIGAAISYLASLIMNYLGYDWAFVISITSILLSVSDNGVGMDTETTGNIFDGEQNESSAGTLNEKGSGLGLILTRDYVEMLGGTITVESELGKGTSVYMRFPNKIPRVSK